MQSFFSLLNKKTLNNLDKLNLRKIYCAEELVDKAILQASFAKEDTENYNSDIQQQIMADLKKGLAPSQVKGQEKRTVLRHGSAVKKQEVQKSEAAIQRHTSLVSPTRSITSPPTSGQSTPKLKRPTSQACSVM